MAVGFHGLTAIWAFHVVQAAGPARICPYPSANSTVISLFQPMVTSEPLSSTSGLPFSRAIFEMLGTCKACAAA